MGPRDTQRGFGVPRPADFTTGIHAHDIARLERALVGLNFPVERWEVLDYATRLQHTSAPENQPSPRTVDQLWTLPNRRYDTFDEVVRALARTLRGHPRASRR